MDNRGFFFLSYAAAVLVGQECAFSFALHSLFFLSPLWTLNCRSSWQGRGRECSAVLCFDVVGT